MRFIRLAGSDELVGVGKIICVGRNYVEHAREMRADLPDHPVLFLKPSTALVNAGEEIIIPPVSQNVHHEVEIVAAIARDGKLIPEQDARSYILGYGVGLDMTLRDVQDAAKKSGLPWAIAKGFDTSAPVSEIVPAELISDPSSLEIRCRVNGELRQHGRAHQMLFSIDRLISYISSVFTLERGDLIFTGTPEGVGRVIEGDTIEAELVGYARTQHSVRNLH